MGCIATITVFSSLFSVFDPLFTFDMIAMSFLPAMRDKNPFFDRSQTRAKNRSTAGLSVPISLGPEKSKK
jgi:hypothetical protein